MNYISTYGEIKCDIWIFRQQYWNVIPYGLSRLLNISGLK